MDMLTVRMLNVSIVLFISQLKRLIYLVLLCDIYHRSSFNALPFAFGIKISSNFGAVEVQFITLTLMNCSLHTMTTLSLTLVGR